MNLLKKQGAAWAITAVMIAASIGIGQAKAPANPGPDAIEQPLPDSGFVEIIPEEGSYFYVYDDAGVLSAEAEEELGQRNMQLYHDMDVLVAVVTCNYGGDLFDYAMDYAEDIGLGAYDFIVVLDISGDNYWLVQGAELVDSFTDQDCSDYAWEYMEDAFARGDYDDAALNLVSALSDWYYDNY